AALTSRIRMGAAIKLIHLHHPLDVAIQGAITHHMLGSGNRYIFGFGSGFPSPLFAVERGLTYEDRHERLRESLDFILKAWTEPKPFDWDGKHWRGKGIVALPKPDELPHLATATESDDMIALAAQKGWTLLTAFLEPASHVVAKAAKYEAAARAAGRPPRGGVAVSRIVYIADSQRQAIEEMRAAVAYEVSVQAQRGFLKMLKNVYKVDVPNDARAIEALVESGLYIVGDPDTVAARIAEFYRATGGFGTFLMVTGKAWSTRENRTRSMRRFMAEVVPQLRHLGSEAATARPVAAS
ncbi:MAG: LLM class flavin-dependent oxidoreductase, partial [Rhodospirillaceae bacterium]|nr:LLM class flavin-dependent oxidoreductase [Rhodospirillaceae bacterium]